MNFLKTTALGGLVFLVPFVILVLLLGKALQLARGLLETLAASVPSITIGGVVLLNLLAVAVLFLLCFLAGLLARSAPARRVGAKLEATLLGVLPGYSIIKGLTSNMQAGEEHSRDFRPVLARFDDNSQLGFEVERSEQGTVVVYLPGCPDPWSGTTVFMTAERITPLDIPVNVALKKIRVLGRGSASLADGA